MKNTMYQQFKSLDELNQKGDKGVYQNKYLRSILTAKEYYNPKYHKKGVYFIKDENNVLTLMIAYRNITGKKRYNYAPAISVKKISTKK